MKVRFWGTRGSLAKPGPATIRYGGNTSCVEVRTDDGKLLILDCGTGAHELGQHLTRESSGPIKGSLLISHTHWDHIQGFPFFAPFFVPEHEWDIYAPQGFGETLRTTLAGQMEYTYFPITPEAFGATLHYHNVTEGEFWIGDVHIRTRFLNHPALTIGYRIEADGATLVYACDHEPHARTAALATGDIDGQDALHADFLQGADLVIHDAQYTAAEYSVKEGWGHSTIEYAVKVCELAGVARLALTHHDPLRDDAAVDRLLSQAQGSKDPAGRLEVLAAAEGLILDIKGSADKPRPRPREMSPRGDIGRRSGQTILIVTADEELLGRISEAVDDEGFAIAQAATMEEAVSLALDASLPLIVIDGSLPDHTVTALAHSSASAPMIVIGEDGLTSDLPNVEYISASFSREYLRSRIQTWLLRGKFGELPACIPELEAKRLATVRSLQLLDTPAEERFDALTRIAARTFGVPMSLITLVDEDRQWFKSRVGLELAQTPRHMSFCAHAIMEPEPMIVSDALEDKRFVDNPLVTGPPRIRFYAGVPVHVGGEAVGTLCLLDTKPRVPAEGEVRLLKDLGCLVQLELTRGLSN